jgi:hypothetical protein
VQESSELQIPHPLRLEPEVLADGECEEDDALAMASRVPVIGLDDVAENQRRASVCVTELEQALEAGAPLT